jgi:hypothetical protein
MSAGMMMMLKSMGFDPEVLKQNVETFKTEITNAVSSVDQRLANIEKQQKQILFYTEQMYNACVNEAESPQGLILQKQLRASVALEDAKTPGPDFVTKAGTRIFIEPETVNT